jgi:hypothetical protein
MVTQPTSRRLEVVSALFSEYKNCNRWAIIVGISKYRNKDWNLQFADRDADEFYKLLLTKNGGRFNPAYIEKLINEEATTRNLTKALRGFLQKPDRDDLVVVYLACHGAPDPNRPENVYLLTHDTDPMDIPGTGLPMREVHQALTENLLAEKVVILADTCHSAALGSSIGRRSTCDATDLVNRYLQEVGQAKNGLALITSAEANEASFEDRRWGNGHGVFTYYLLEGMRGAADSDGNGIVSVGELFEYVRENVKQATDHKQHPSIGSNLFDRNLPLAITSLIPSEQNEILQKNKIHKAKSLNNEEKSNSSFKNIQSGNWRFSPLKSSVKSLLTPKLLIGTALFFSAILVVLSQVMMIGVSSPKYSIQGFIKMAPNLPNPIALYNLSLSESIKILEAYKINIYYPSDRSDLKAKADSIENIFPPDFRDSNINSAGKPNSFFEQYDYPYPTVDSPGNEIRYTASNTEGAKYLESALKVIFPNEIFHSLQIGDQPGKYVSIFVGP